MNFRNVYYYLAICGGVGEDFPYKINNEFGTLMVSFSSRKLFKEYFSLFLYYFGAEVLIQFICAQVFQKWHEMRMLLSLMWREKFAKIT